MKRTATCAAVFLAACAMSGGAMAEDNQPYDPAIIDACFASYSLCSTVCDKAYPPTVPGTDLGHLLCEADCYDPFEACLGIEGRGGKTATPTQRGTAGVDPERQVDPTPRPRPRRPAPSTLPGTMSR